MKQSDTLELVNAGSLAKPGVIGRMMRLSLGIVCYYALYQLMNSHEVIILSPVSTAPNLVLLTGAAICIVNYVVNIGFGVSWGRWPSIVSIAVIGVIAIGSWLVFGTADHWILGGLFWAWLVYFYLHLGTSFLLASLLATPGCEMRAIPELLGKISGHPS